MGATLPNLSLYQPGGGSSGTITPDEVADIDRLNDNAKKIDDWAGLVNAFRAAQATRNQQFSGLATDKALVSGMKRGDTYQETDGTYPQIFVFDGTNWKNRTRAYAQLVSGTAAINGSVTLNWSGAGAGFVFQDGQKFWDSTPDPLSILVPLSGRYRVVYNTRTSLVAPLTVSLFKNGSDMGVLGQASGSGVSGAASHAQKSFLVDLAAADTLQLRVVSNGAAAMTSLFTIEYLGEA